MASEALLQNVGSLEAHNAATRLAGKEPLIEVPAAAPDYSKLQEGYTAYQVSSWAEKRTCVKTGHSGLYSTKSIKAGDVLSDFGPKAITDTPNYLTVQVGESKHIMLSPEWLQNINHSCAPNVYFNTSSFQLEALTDVEPGTDLCFFYPSTEWEMDAPFQCCCGTPQCLGRIAGAGAMGAERMAGLRLNEHITAKLGLPSTP